jgi:hypothetical protein
MFLFRSLWIGAALVVLGALPLQAAAISVLVAETGLRREVPVSESSGLWESGLLDGFFDQGHIVSNAPIARLEGKAGQEFPEELRGDLNEALEGGMEYMVLVLLDYGGYSGAGVPRPRGISIRLFRLRPLQCITEKHYPGGDAKKPEEVLAMAKNTAGILLPHLADNQQVN